jgi:hypothetical protein
MSVRSEFGKESDMFLRRCKRRKNDRQHIYWALVESYRTARGSRQRVVAYLGELKSSEQSGWAQLARRLDGRSRPQRSLFDPPHYDDPTDEEPVAINLKGVRLERIRDFGDVVLPARARNAQVSKTIRLRCVTTPDEAQKVLLNRLGLSLPQRLRRIDEVIQM